MKDTTQAYMERYKCPKCGSERLEVSIETWATLIQTDNGFETDTTTASCGDHEWSENSVMLCCDCGEQDIADAFNVEAETDAPQPAA